MPGREPEKKNRYYSPKVTWLLVILVGIAIIVVGLMFLSDEHYTLSQKSATVDSLQTAAPESANLNVEIPEAPHFDEKKDLTKWWPFEDALKEVNGFDRFAMIFFRSPDCAPCDSMQYMVFDQPQIQDAFKFKFLPVKISSDSKQVITYQGRKITESGMAGLFNIPGYPTLLFYDGRTEKFILTYPGYINADKLTRIFEYLKTRMFENSSMTLQRYLSEEE